MCFCREGLYISYRVIAILLKKRMLLSLQGILIKIPGLPFMQKAPGCAF